MNTRLRRIGPARSFVLSALLLFAPSGVSAQTPAPTNTPTSTVVPPTGTPTVIPNTPTSTVVAPTGTATVIPNTPTSTVVAPTGTATASPNTPTAVPNTPTVLPNTPTSLPSTPTVTATVVPDCTILPLPANLPDGTVGVAYAQQLTVTASTPPVSFGAAGTLPSGLTLSAAGLLSGTPTAAGTFSFTVQVTDAGNCASQAAYSLDIVQTVPATPTMFLILLALMLAGATWMSLRRREA